MMLRKSIKTRTTHILTPHWYQPKRPGFSYEGGYEALSGLLAQIHGIKLEVGLFFDQPFEGSIVLQVDTPNEVDKSVIKKVHRLAEYWKDSFCIRADIEWTNPREIAFFNKNRAIKSSKDVVFRTCSHFSQEIVTKMLVLMSCYLPGSSRCLHYYYEDKLFGIFDNACESSFDHAAVMMMEAGVPPSPNMSFLDFIKWSLKVGGFWKGLPSTNVGRALNFISHAHHRVRQNNSLSDIPWIVAALEALFTESNQEIRAKIIRRTVLLCPEVEKFASRKSIGNLYDFRSRFLHGDIIIPNAFNSYDDGKWYGHDFYKALHLSSAILFKSIHRIAENGWTDLTFVESPCGS